VTDKVKEIENEIIKSFWQSQSQ